MNIASIFHNIESAHSIEDLHSIVSDHHWQMDIDRLNIKYPFLPFEIQAEEIDQLIDKGILNEQHQLQLKKIPSADPLVKLLTSLIWKNGDFHKIRHIADGITGRPTSSSKQNIVFTQFGKSLNRSGEPIIDRHVLRAFACYQYPDRKNHFLKKKVYKNSDAQMITEYGSWFKAQVNRIAPAEQLLFSQLLDRILFIAGKKAE